MSLLSTYNIKNKHIAPKKLFLVLIATVYSTQSLLNIFLREIVGNNFYGDREDAQKM